jgi:superfamily II DNA/RNA helicase
MTDFADFELPTALVESLARMKVVTPTAVQRETIPVALAGKDILASAQTGTGKTVAYLIPLIMRLSKSQDMALILAPTRELAIQVHQTLDRILGRSGSFRTALLIGGAPIFKQFADLKRKPKLIVGTPGRITDHLERGSLSLSSTRFLIIDEADRMLDMGFGIQLDKIAEYLPKGRQTLMFSATLPPNIEKLSKRYLTDPTRITINTTNQPAPKIKQETLHISDSEKWPHLLKQLETREGSVIVFVRTKIRAMNLARDLKEQGHRADSMHGDLPQRRRERVIDLFRSSKSRILVATDVAARGLDIPHVMHVINYDLPECPEDYVHRIGRTGRADAEGFALSLISPKESGKWRAISRLINPNQQQEKPKQQQQQGHKKPVHKFKPRKGVFKKSLPPRPHKNKHSKKPL